MAVVAVAAVRVFSSVTRERGTIGTLFCILNNVHCDGLDVEGTL